MAKSSTSIPSANVNLDPSSSIPLYRQIYDALRQAILSGRLVSGARLSSTRELASELGVSRITVMNAFEQLLAEGYLESRIGSGTQVCRDLPEDLLNVRIAMKAKTARNPCRKPRLSKPGETISEIAVGVSPNQTAPRPFMPGIPALDAFPREVWGRLVARHWSYPRTALLSYGEAAGYRPLREAIAAHLGIARAVHCKPEQVIIVAGVQQGLDLTARMLLNAGDLAWIEEYNYLAARAALLGAGARLIPVPVDDEGLKVGAGIALAPRARLVYLTPSHQYPLGVTMTLARRLALLDWAQQAGAWIIEDDYDSEYRYSGRPLSALQGLDQHGRVIYLGTFSKVLFPSLRLGYVVAPPDLVEAFVKAREVVGWCSSVVDQAVLAEFIAEGHFARHLRRMRSLYSERQSVLIEAVKLAPCGLLEVQPDPTGIHLVGWLPEGLDDRAVSQAASRLGVEVQPLSAFRFGKGCQLSRGGLVLGYGAYRDREIKKAINKLLEAIRLSC